MLVPAAAQRAERRIGIQHGLRRHPTEKTDDAGPEQRQLPLEPDVAGLNLLRLRVAIVRRPAFDGVHDIDLIAIQTEGGEHAIQKLSGASDKGQSLAVLLLAGRLADEHEIRMRVAAAEHDMGAAVGQRTAAAVGGLPRQLLQPSAGLRIRLSRL